MLQRTCSCTADSRKPAVPEWHGLVQAKLKLGHAGDSYEQEADRVADQVMRMPDSATQENIPVRQPAGLRIQQMCSQCEQEMHRKQNGGKADEAGAQLESRIAFLRNGGEPISPRLRDFFEPRFGYDFQQVRLHTDPAANDTAHEAEALAFTVGRDIVFAAGQYEPASEAGRKLLAHELTHVVQQQHAAPVRPGSHAQGEAAARPAVTAPAPILSRGDPQATSITMNVGTAPRSGLQFWPTTVRDTQVGPVSVQGGLLSGGTSRLHVIVAENETIRRLARQLRPFFLVATPFTPPGAAAPLPLPIVSVDELAQALLVYNQYYLPVPAMTNWRAGLNFPLPIAINPLTGMATLHPLLIQSLAGGFSATWAPLLDTLAASPAAPPPATLAADVTAFLTNEPTALGRGISLGARAVTNAMAELPFVREVFRRLGAGAFDVALAFMDNLVNAEIDLLAAQRDGSAILAEIRNALAAPSGVLSADQTQSLARANLMLGRVAATVAVAPPTAARSRAEKSVTIDTVRLDGSNHTPSVDVAVASAIFSQCNVRLMHGVDATATPAQTTGWLGGNTDLRVANVCGSLTGEQRALFVGASTQFGLTARLRAFFVASYSGYSGNVAFSLPAYCATGPAAVARGMLIIQNVSGRGDLAHEAVHVVRNSGAHLPDPNLMGSNPLSVQLNDAQCTDIYNHA
jgi:hypothetical protein